MTRAAQHTGTLAQILGAALVAGAAIHFLFVGRAAFGHFLSGRRSLTYLAVVGFIQLAAGGIELWIGARIRRHRRIDRIDLALAFWFGSPPALACTKCHPGDVFCSMEPCGTFSRRSRWSSLCSGAAKRLSACEEITGTEDLIRKHRQSILPVTTTRTCVAST